MVLLDFAVYNLKYTSLGLIGSSLEGGSLGHESLGAAAVGKRGGINAHIEPGTKHCGTCGERADSGV